MNSFPLTVLAGAEAKKRLSADGWSPELFSTLVGASGGAKMLGLVHLDRMLFADYLSRSQHPMSLYGSSIGSWRLATLAAENPLAALELLQDRYLNQRWAEDDNRRPAEVVDELCHWVLDGFCDQDFGGHLSQHKRFTTHIITARGKGLNGFENRLALGLGMALSGVGNLLTRRSLGVGFQRIVFSSGSLGGFQFKDFDSVHVPLSADNVKSALLASGSIPFLMPGQRNIPGAPPGHYWDGGIVDYHFDFANYQGDGLVLYPHFSAKAVKGWFDKSLPWRQNSADLLDKVVILAPSPSYLAQLPYGKIPDRGDFSRFSQSDRLVYWQEAVDQSRLLAEAFEEVISSTDPLARVQAIS